MENCNTYLSRRGYVARKSALNAMQIAQIKRDLTVSPFNPVKAELTRRMKPEDIPDDSFRVYQETTNKFYMPRYYAEGLLGPPEGNTLCDAGDAASPDVLFHGTLRDVQQQVATNTIAHLRQRGGGLLQLRCGFGKTIIALNLVAQLGLKTIVLVHKEFLMNQWKERIEQFLPAARVGTLQAKTVDVDGKDIVIGMLQSVATDKYTASILQPFGMAIFDECHHLGAAVFSKAMGLVRTRYMLGLSATPDRKDKLRKVFDWQLGEVICKVESKVTQRVDVRTVSFDDPDVITMEDGTIVVKLHGDQPFVYRERVPALRCKLLEHVVTSVSRRQLLLTVVAEYAADSNRRILVLSERRAQLTELGHELDKKGLSYGFYWGGVKQAALDDAAEQQIVLGTFHMASEGMDIPILNTVVLASPRSDVQQSVGRILRRTDHPVVPCVVDIVDARIPCFANSRHIRNKFYRKCGFRVDGKDKNKKTADEDETEKNGSQSEAFKSDVPSSGYAFK
jgi:superfamily II DNA or RNA helicase